MKMIRDTINTSRIIVILVLIITLSNRTSGGSWKNLERMFIQDHHNGAHWDENRIIFPDMIEDVTESRLPSTTTPRSDVARRPCEAYCKVSKEFDPVCGTNGVTYQNMDQLLCAIRCGDAVDLHRPSACSTATPAWQVTTTSTTEFAAIIRNDEVEQCIRTCPSTPEYNPVCGTNKVTYHNMGKLRCAKYCGVDVELWRHAPCPNLRTTTVEPTTHHDEDNVRKECILNCPYTSQYDPVCGTDNVTYDNIGRLECAKWCGVDVSVQKHGRCMLTNIEHFENFGPTTEVYYGEDSIDPRYRPRGSTQ